MANLLVCLDGSAYADNICQEAAWIAKKLEAKVHLLHVLKRHSDYRAEGEDHTGAIGLGARSSLLNKLTLLDEQRGRLDQEKGKLILQHGVDVLASLGVTDIETHHVRGNFLEIVKEYDDLADLILIGKRGEEAQNDAEQLGSNLESLARSIKTPLLAVSSKIKQTDHFMIAYDGRAASEQAVSYICQSSLVVGKRCHLVTVAEENSTLDLTSVIAKLRAAGFDLLEEHITSDRPAEALARYVEEHDVSLVFSGAYSHSKLRSLIWDSVTSNLLRSCHASVMMFKK